MVRRLAGLVAFVALPSLLGAATASGQGMCGDGRTSLAKMIADADAIFVGTALQVKKDDSVHGPGNTARFLVKQWWKGNPPKQSVVASNFGPCTFLFRKGADYLVFAWEDDIGRYSTIVNMGTDQANAAERVIERLGRSRAPTFDAFRPSAAACAPSGANGARIDGLLLDILVRRSNDHAASGKASLIQLFERGRAVHTWRNVVVKGDVQKRAGGNPRAWALEAAVPGLPTKLKIVLRTPQGGRGYHVAKGITGRAGYRQYPMRCNGVR